MHCASMLNKRWTTPAWRKIGTKKRKDWSGPPGPSIWLLNPPNPHTSDIEPVCGGVGQDKRSKYTEPEEKVNIHVVSEVETVSELVAFGQVQAMLVT